LGHNFKEVVMDQVRILKGIISIPITIKKSDGSETTTEGGFREDIYGSIWAAMYGDKMITASVELNGKFQYEIEKFIKEQSEKLKDTKVGNLEI